LSQYTRGLKTPIQKKKKDPRHEKHVSVQSEYVFRTLFMFVQHAVTQSRLEVQSENEAITNGNEIKRKWAKRDALTLSPLEIFINYHIYN
jgi:hypothetical protein